MRRREFGAGIAALTAAGVLPTQWAVAQTRAQSLRVLSEAAPNSFDPIGIGVNRNAIQVHWNTYDRLVRFGTQLRPDGVLYYDYYHIEGEIAEHYEFSEDKRSITFTLRTDASFHDGTPITAEDVKWSLDRVVANPIGKSQFSTGSMTSPEQFQILNGHTVRVTTPRPDRFTLPNLALTYPIIINSKLARAHATATDPWAGEWLKTHIAGGGPFKLESYVPGQRLLFSRFDAWKNGTLPGFRRILWQAVSEAQARIAALQRGDADIVQDLPPSDAAALLRDKAIKMIGVPMQGAFQFIGMNGTKAPFDNVKVRQGIAYALPYKKMFELALFGRGRPLFGGVPDVAEGTAFPQPLGYSTDPAKAKALLAQAGYPHGFSTTFSFELSLATIAEPVAVLVQEALGDIGVKVTINKVPAGQLGTLLQNKDVPFFFEDSASYLSDPDYFFRIFYYGPTRWNFGSYHNPQFETLVKETRFETDKAIYDADVKRMIGFAKRDVPIILLWEPFLNLGTQKSIGGYKYEFHRELDFRTLKRL